MAKNKHLYKAKINKKDEFYTRLEDIVAEILQHPDVAGNFKNKVVYMNCDDPEESHFVKFFQNFFKELKLKKIIATHYRKDGSFKFECSGPEQHGSAVKTPLEGDGDFRSEECVSILKEADIVVTNPPFSLFREYVAQLIEYDKRFLIIGNQNAVAYKKIFPLIKENKIWLSYGFQGGAAHFRNKFYEDYANAGDHKEGMIRVSGVVWFTNLEISKKKEHFILTKSYTGNEEEYPKYDNYDAIHVSRTADIPKDYFGVMGVPITFLDKYCPEQFEIIGISSKEHCGTVQRLHDNSYYDGYTRGKVVTRIESNLPLLATPEKGGTKCVKENHPDLYQLYWRLFIRRRGEYSAKEGDTM